MDRQEAALIIMGVPLRQLLMAVHNVDRVIDVQDHRQGRRHTCQLKFQTG
jgi:hypothetical protein